MPTQSAEWLLDIILERREKEEVTPSSFLPIFHIGAKQLTHPLSHSVICYPSSAGVGAWRNKAPPAKWNGRDKKKKKKIFFIFYFDEMWVRRINYFL
jgi:hypothetical protein